MMGLMQLLGMGGGLAPGMIKDVLGQAGGADIKSLLGNVGAGAIAGGAPGAEALAGAGAAAGAAPEGGFKSFLGNMGKEGPHSSEGFLGRAGNVAHSLDNNNGFRGLTGQQPRAAPQSQGVGGIPQQGSLPQGQPGQMPLGQGGQIDLSQLDPRVVEAIKQAYGNGGGNGAF